MSSAVITYPTATFGLSCDYDNTFNNNIWCFGGGGGSTYQSVYSFDGSTFTSKVNTGSGFYAISNGVTIVNGIAYLIDDNREYISSYVLSTGAYINIWSNYAASGTHGSITSNRKDTLYFGCFRFNKNIYEIEISTGIWTKITADPVTLHYQGGLTFWNDKLVVFGGQNVIANKIEFIAVNPQGSVWITSSQQANFPDGMDSFTYYTIYSGVLYTFGGRYAFVFSDRIYVRYMIYLMI